MNILIHGTNFVNKGAELMLHAINQQLQNWEECQSVSVSLSTGNFRQRKQLDLTHLIWREAFRPPYDRIPYTIYPIYWSAKVLPKFIRRAINISIETDIDVVLDASGFFLSDQCGISKQQRMAILCQKWKSQRKKVILLPQAFGPFNNTQVREAAQTILQNADLVFARDEISYEEITKLGKMTNHVKLFPDFTNLVDAIEPSYGHQIHDRVCVILNYRMIDRTSEESRDLYLTFIQSCLEILHDKRLKPYILIHELEDYEFALDITQSFGSQIQIIKVDSSLHLKGIIKNSRFVISSRFHGAVSALSQGVPCIVSGWSHKYNELIKDYQNERYLIELTSKEETLKHLKTAISELNDREVRSLVSNRLIKLALRQKNISNNMWDEIRKYLND
ncbi:MAG: polysaccharide pyruvyl transferase family protein [Cyanobacteria bacterium P01_G01_bin.49]